MNKQLTQFLNLLKEDHYRETITNTQLKTLILKEVRNVLKDRTYASTLIFNILFFLGLSYLFTKQPYEPALRRLFMELMFIVLPSFTVGIVSFVLLQEKFSDEKLIRIFEAMLTTPISLTTIWAGKIVSIFLLSYVMIILGIVSLCVIWDMNGLNPFSVLSTEVWLMTLFISPLYVMTYVTFLSWTILRFKQHKLIGMLSFLSMGIIGLIFFNSGNIVKSIPIGHVVNWSMLYYSILGLIIAFSIILILIKNLDKENVAI